MQTQTIKKAKRLVLAYTFVGALIFATNAGAQQVTYQEYVKNLLKTNVKEWLNNPIVIDSIKSQNIEHITLTQDKIDNLDKQWRKERKSKKQPLISSVLSNDLSKYLKDIKKTNQGLFSEIFVMDNKGLNVGQSDVTSDYWQGDEDKWQKTYLSGTDTMVLGDREYDESSKRFLIQVSVPVFDPDNQQPIGAATIGISLVKLIRQVTVASQTR